MPTSFFPVNKPYTITKYILFSAIVLLSCAGEKKKNLTSHSANADLIKDTGRILGYFRRANDSPSSAIERTILYRKALRESISADYSEGVVRAVLNITADFFEQGKFDSCYKYFDLGYKYAPGLTFEKYLLSKLYINYGTFYYLQGNYIKADSLYYAGLQSTKNEKNFDDPKFDLLYNLHFIKNEIGQKHLAIQYLDQAEKLSKANDNLRQLKMVLMAKAQYYTNEKHNDTAEKYLVEFNAVNKEPLNLDQIYGTAEVISNSVIPENAISILQKGIAMASTSNVDFYRITLYIKLASVYNKLHMYDKAELILKPIIKENIEKGFKYSLKDGYSNLAETYEKLGKYKYALEAIKKLHSVNDSLLAIDKIRTLNELELKYKTAEKDKQLTINNLKISQQQNKISRQTTWIISIASFVVLLLTLFFFYTILKKHQIVSLKQQQQINNLRSKMEGEENERQRLARDLHDGIGGMLSAALMQTSKLEEENPALKESITFDVIKSTIKATAVDVRQTANNLMPDPIIKLGLAEAIRQYCYTINKPSSLQLNVQTYGELNLLNMSLKLAVYRIVQELLHNIIKHSMATEVLIQVAYNNKMVGIAVEDNGKGFDVKSLRSGSGLNNIQLRVENFNGKFDLSSNIDKGTAIGIEIPISNK